MQPSNSSASKTIECLQGEIHNLRHEINGAAAVDPDIVPDLELRLMLREYQLYAIKRNIPWDDAFPSKAVSLSEQMFKDAKKQLEYKENVTAYGEPQVFISLDNGRSLEITFEQEGLPQDAQFYSIRLHCSDKEYERNLYQATAGVIFAFTTDGPSLDEVKDGILLMLLENEVTRGGVVPENKHLPLNQMILKAQDGAAKQAKEEIRERQSPMTLKAFLGQFDFGYDVYENSNQYEAGLRRRLIAAGDLDPKYLNAPLIGLIDKQCANFGDIDRDRFPIDNSLVPNIIARMDIYINDVISEFDDTLEENGFDPSYLSLREKFYICKGLKVEAVCYKIAEAVLSPEKIFVPEMHPEKEHTKQAPSFER